MKQITVYPDIHISFEYLIKDFFFYHNGTSHISQCFLLTVMLFSSLFLIFFFTYLSYSGLTNKI